MDSAMNVKVVPVLDAQCYLMLVLAQTVATEYVRVTGGTDGLTGAILDAMVQVGGIIEN